MPDFGLTEALAKALQASKGVEVMRPAEQALAARAAKTAPAAPAVPNAVAASDPSIARVPSAQAPPAEPPPGATQAPPVNPSQPPADLPPAAAAPDPQTAPAPAPVAQASGDATPPVGAVAASQEPPMAVTPKTPPPGVPTGNRLPADTTPPPAPAIAPSVQQTARDFVSRSLGTVTRDIDMTRMPNTDVMASPDQVKSAILQIADRVRGQIDASRRGTIADHQLIGLATDLAVNGDVVKQVMERELGQVLNPETLLAARMVEQYHMGTLLGLSDRVASGSATSAEVIRFEQQTQFIEQYRAQLSGAQSEWGRAGRGLQIPVGLPTQVMDHVSDVISRNNPNLQATAKAIKLAGTPSGIASIVQGSLWYRALVKAPFGLLQRIYINGILSGPPTWLKIAVGNNFNLAANQLDLFAGATMRSMTDLAARIGRWPTAAEGAEWGDATAHLHGVISGGADALRVAGRVLRTGQSMDGILRAEEDFGRNTVVGALPEIDNSWFGSLARGIDTGIGIPGRVIGAVDDFTKTLGYRGFLTKEVMKEVRARLEAGTLRPGDVEAVTQDLMQNPSEEMQQAAEAWAHRMTFQSPWPVTADGQPLAGARFQAWLNAVPAARFVFPFMRTATNIFKQTVERTPFAFFSERMRNAIMAGGAEGDIARGRLVTGTAIGTMLAWMAINDRITGDAPKDPKTRLAWEADGRKPYSVRMTDPVTGKEEWNEYMWFEPLATLAGVVADSVQLHSYLFHTNDVYSMMPEDDRMNDVTAHIMASIIQNTGNKTFMQGAAQFAEMYNDPQRAFTMWRDQMAAASVPYSGFLKFMRNEQDPFLRQAFTLMDKIRDELPTIPGVNGSKTLMPRLDLFGEGRKTTSGNSLLGPLTPMPSSPITKDEVTEELHRLMEQTRTVPLTMPSRQINFSGSSGAGLQDGSGMRLTPQEYYEYVRKARADPIFNGGTQTFRERLAQLIASPVYQEASPPDRAAFFSRIQHEADEAGRNKLWNENQSFRERMTAWTAEKNRLKSGQ